MSTRADPARRPLMSQRATSIAAMAALSTGPVRQNIERRSTCQMSSIRSGSAPTIRGARVCSMSAASVCSPPQELAGPVAVQSVLVGLHFDDHVVGACRTGDEDVDRRRSSSTPDDAARPEDAPGSGQRRRAGPAHLSADFTSEKST